MAIIEINDLNFTYGQNPSSDQFNLSIKNWSIEKGDFVSIIGPNGCGKSTLLKLLAGINKPLSGTIKISGQNIEQIKRKSYSKTIAYVPQSVVSVFPFSVYEIVMMGRTPYLNFMGFEKIIDQTFVEEALDLMELSNLRNKGINEISGGELQRVFIARALAQKSEIILLDEPNSHLDIKHQISIFELLLKLSLENNLTIVTVSHDLNLVGIYSKNIVFMHNGAMEIVGDKKKIFTQENIQRIFDVNTLVKFTDKCDSANVLIMPQQNY